MVSDTSDARLDGDHYPGAVVWGFRAFTFWFFASVHHLCGLQIDFAIVLQESFAVDWKVRRARPEKRPPGCNGALLASLF